MGKKIKTLVLRTAGTNCDMETSYAFELAGAIPECVHINKLIANKGSLLEYDILAIPGGFSYGDDIASGKILANEIKFNLRDVIAKFIGSGRIIIGICNGFQVLVKSGLLPDPKNKKKSIKTSLSLNDSAKFEDRWIYLRSNERSECIWTRGLSQKIYLPVAHAEGKFIPKNKNVLRELEKNGQIVLRYTTKDGGDPVYPYNPNGSTDDIAGICDKSGRIFGLMPHPERHIFHTQHPFWTRMPKRLSGDGLKIFKNGVEFIRSLG